MTLAGCQASDVPDLMNDRLWLADGGFIDASDVSRRTAQVERRGAVVPRSMAELKEHLTLVIFIGAKTCTH